MTEELSTEQRRRAIAQVMYDSCFEKTQQWLADDYGVSRITIQSDVKSEPYLDELRTLKGGKIAKLQHKSWAIIEENIIKKNEDTAKWVLEKTDPDCAIRLKHEISLPPAPVRDIESDLAKMVEAAYSGVEIVDDHYAEYEGDRPDADNGKSGNGES